MSSEPDHRLREEKYCLKENSRLCLRRTTTNTDVCEDAFGMVLTIYLYCFNAVAGERKAAHAREKKNSTKESEEMKTISTPMHIIPVIFVFTYIQKGHMYLLISRPSQVK